MEELYNKLFEAGEYTKSFDEFVQQYGDAEKSEKLFKGLSQTGDYTKSFEEFKSQYGFAEKKTQIPLQKRSLRNPLQMWKQILPLWILRQQQQALIYL